MTKQELAELLERVTSWSEEAKEELAHSIVEIESRYANDYELTDEDRAAIERGQADIRAGRIVSDEDITAMFNRYFP